MSKHTAPLKQARGFRHAASPAFRHYSSRKADAPANLTRFLCEYERATMPMAGRPGTRILRACPGISFRVREIDGRIWLGLIFTDTPGRGFGRQGLQWLCEIADQCQVSLYLMVGRPERLGPQFPSNNALSAWYARNGFADWGREGDKPVMVRPAQSTIGGVATNPMLTRH